MAKARSLQVSSQGTSSCTAGARLIGVFGFDKTRDRGVLDGEGEVGSVDVDGSVGVRSGVSVKKVCMPETAGNQSPWGQSPSSTFWVSEEQTGGRAPTWPGRASSGWHSHTGTALPDPARGASPLRAMPGTLGRSRGASILSEGAEEPVAPRCLCKNILERRQLVEKQYPTTLSIIINMPEGLCN